MRHGLFYNVCSEVLIHKSSNPILSERISKLTVLLHSIQTFCMFGMIFYYHGTGYAMKDSGVYILRLFFYLFTNIAPTDANDMEILFLNAIAILLFAIFISFNLLWLCALIPAFKELRKRYFVPIASYYYYFYPQLFYMPLQNRGIQIVQDLFDAGNSPLAIIVILLVAFDFSQGLSYMYFFSLSVYCNNDYEIKTKKVAVAEYLTFTLCT